MIGAALDEAERVAREHVNWCIANGYSIPALLSEISEPAAANSFDEVVAAVARAWMPVAHAGTPVDKPKISDEANRVAGKRLGMSQPVAIAA